jgi:hypothetical protein
MLSEHEQLTDALNELTRVAREERKPAAVAFADARVLHAQNR